MMPLVSIVIPCYRQGHLLPVAIESALAQDYPAVEVVVANDGSDDDTDAVARRYGERIRYVAKPNGGLSVARNSGVAAAAGDRLLFLDADDAIHAEAVSRLVAAGRGVDDPLAVMGWQPFETDPRETVGPARLPPDDPIRTTLERGYGPPHNYLTTRSLFERVGGFDRSLSGCADWDFWLRQFFAGATPVVVPFVGAFYRQSSNQMSRQQMHMDEDLARTVGRVARRIASETDRVRAWGFDPRALRRSFRTRAAREYLNVGYHRRERGDYLKAAGHYVRSMWFGGWRTGATGLAKLPVVMARRAAGRGAA